MSRTRLLIAAVSLCTAGAAFAQEGTQDFPQPAYQPWTARAAQPVSAPSSVGEAEQTVVPQSSKTRAQVVAETREAMRLGLVGGNELTMQQLPSVAQLEQVRLAGLRALEPQMAGVPSPQQP